MALFSIVLLLTAALSLMFRDENSGGRERVAVITVAGKPFQTVRLSGEARREILVTTPDGINRLVVADGAIACVEADCPAQLCRRQGPVRDIGAVIACLPHQMLVEVRAAP
ncbi:MAG: NusG domain II-containing protein [Schwartzia sp.]|nr:NusG domain II-containing protein [Schwartzia sp. (in: firmicutes)]